MAQCQAIYYDVRGVCGISIARYECRCCYIAASLCQPLFIPPPATWRIVNSVVSGIP